MNLIRNCLGSKQCVYFYSAEYSQKRRGFLAFPFLVSKHTLNWKSNFYSEVEMIIVFKQIPQLINGPLMSFCIVLTNTASYCVI